MKIKFVITSLLCSIIGCMENQDINKCKLNTVLVKPSVNGPMSPASLMLNSSWVVITNIRALLDNKLPAEVLEYVNKIKLIISSNLSFEQKKFLINLINNQEIDVNYYFSDLVTKCKDVPGKDSRQKILNDILLHVANYRDPVLTMLVLKFGADINVQDYQGYTPLMHAVLYGRKCTVQLLLENGADCDFKNFKEETALIVAVMHNAQEIVNMLLKAGADMNVKDIYGDSALMRAAYTGRVEIAQMLIMAGADIDDRNIEGNTALIYAVKEKQKAVIKILLEVKADVNLQNKRRETALSLARASRSQDIVDLLLEYKN